MKKLLFILLSAASVANATTYYVRKDGNDSNTGTADNAGGAWLTVDKAASTAAAGDTVYIRQGFYNESATVDNTGSSGSPITFIGERDVDGSWLTIIDSSTSASNNWFAYGAAGIYTNTSIGFQVSELEIGGKRIGFAYTNGDMQSMIDTAYTGSGLTTGVQLLGIATGQTYNSPLNNTTVTFWDGIEAMFTSSSGTTWLRLRDGSNPNGLPIRVNNGFTGDPSNNLLDPVITVSGKDYIVLSNLWVRGAYTGILLNDADNCIVSSNRINGGYCRLGISGTSSTNNIYFNDISTDWYATTYSFGSWACSDTYDTTESNAHLNHYLVGKYLMGKTTQLDIGIKLDGVGYANTVKSNYIHDIVNEGIYFDDQVGALVYGNSISNVSSHGIYILSGTIVNIYDNKFWDCAISVRMNNMNTASDSRTVNVYRNTFYLPSNIGWQMYFHNADSSAAGTALFRAYNNSFSGGRFIVTAAGVPASGPGSMTNCWFVNNIMSDGLWIGNAGSSPNTGFFDNQSVALFDYNMTALPAVTQPSSSDPVWWGSHNIKTNANVWTTTAGMSFALPSGSVAIDNGQNLVTAYPTWPQDSTAIIGSWDIGALEYGEPPPIPPAAGSGVSTIFGVQFQIKR